MLVIGGYVVFSSGLARLTEKVLLTWDSKDITGGCVAWK
jgi:hypothetical protein